MTELTPLGTGLEVEPTPPPTLRDLPGLLGGLAVMLAMLAGFLLLGGVVWFLSLVAGVVLFVLMAALVVATLVWFMVKLCVQGSLRRFKESADPRRP